jgi:HlyD family secretion protein
VRIAGWTVVAVIVLGAGYWWFGSRAARATGDFQYHTAKAERRDVLRSISATGVLQALTLVDVKSKAGGAVRELLVEEGSYVRAGDLIACIDPTDTRSLYEQATADLRSTVARKTQAEYNHEIQVETAQLSISQAEDALAAARTQLSSAQKRAKSQEALYASSVQAAASSLESATQSLKQLREATIPLARSEAQGEATRAAAALAAADSSYKRQQELFAKGFVAQAGVEAAKSELESARAAKLVADRRLAVLEQDLASQEKAAEARVAEASASLDTAKAGVTDVEIRRAEVEEAELSVSQAEATLDIARAAKRQDDVTQAEITAATASVTRSEAAVENAKAQLDSTTVVAPREGVVIQKYLEEGTIIPPGTSTFAQGTSIVQIADVSKMYVDVAVDEADIGMVTLGQEVEVRLDAFPMRPLIGHVSRIMPRALLEESVTTIHVRVEIGAKGEQLRPGMNATCKFMISETPNALAVPSEAIKQRGKDVWVEVLEKGKPMKRPVKIGEVGDNYTVVLSGLKEGEEVVTLAIEPMGELERSPMGRLGGGGGGTRR